MTPINLGELEFKAEDFGNIAPMYFDFDKKLMADLATQSNALLRERLGKMEEIYKFEPAPAQWRTYKCEGDTHTARLVCVEKIGEK